MGYSIYKNMTAYFKNYWIWQLVLDGVVDMDVGYKASDPGSSITVEFFYFTFILHSKVVLHVILLKETIWFRSLLSKVFRLKPMQTIETGLWDL